jgi:hypothetical protein
MRIRPSLDPQLPLTAASGNPSFFEVQPNMLLGEERETQTVGPINHFVAEMWPTTRFCGAYNI